MAEIVAIMVYIIHIPLGFNWVFLGRSVVCPHSFLAQLQLHIS